MHATHTGACGSVCGCAGVRVGVRESALVCGSLRRCVGTCGSVHAEIDRRMAKIGFSIVPITAMHVLMTSQTT